MSSKKVLLYKSTFIILAGVPGAAPEYAVLETAALAAMLHPYKYIKKLAGRK